MRILHLSSELTWRGGEQQIAYLIQGLSDRGIESVVAAKKDSSFEKFCQHKSITYMPASFRNEFDLVTAIKIKSFAEKNNVDLVHIHTAKAHGVAVLASIMGMKIPLVLSKRTDFKIKENFFSRFKFNYPKIKKILCVSKKIKEIIDQDLNDPNRSMTVYSGIDLSKFKFDKKYFFHDLLNLSHHIKLVGNTSAIADQKDYFTFVRTAKEILKTRTDIRFLIIGIGPMEQEIKQFVKSQGLEEFILFTGFLNNLSEVLFNLDVFLITSKTEGLGTSILDAHACGIPVVATDAGGISEIVIDGETGSLCPIGDEKCLAQKVLLRLEDHELYKAPELVLKFSKDATVENTLAVYQKILDD